MLVEGVAQPQRPDRAELDREGAALVRDRDGNLVPSDRERAGRVEVLPA